mgnify:CR=1 FL=1
MSLSTILAPIDKEHAAATLALANLVAAKLKAPVNALIVKRDPVDAIPMIGEGISGDIVQQIMDSAEAAAEADAAAVRKAFASWKGDSAAQLSETVGRLENAVARIGRAHGLTVISSSDGMRSAIDAALFETGRPVLLAPLDEVKSVGDRVAIFWKSSAEAAKAVWGAMPFLRTAQKVKVFTVGDSDAELADLQQLRAGLALAGVKVEVQAIAPNSDGDAAQLIDAAADMDADLVVMGGFTHSRLRELVLGGVTETALGNLARPTLLAH